MNKRKLPPKKKYANGTGVNGYIPDPNKVMADYDIMLAKAEQKANNNIGLKIVPIVSSLAQSFIKSGAGASGGGAEAGIGAGEGTTPAAIKGNSQFNSGTFMNAAQQDTFMQNQYAALGMNDAQGAIEAEGGEVVETPGGEQVELNGPSHENGGVDMNVPQGTKIYSDRLKKDGKTMAERKKARELKLSKIDEVLDKNKTDKAIKNAYERRKIALDQEEEGDLMMQEMASTFENMRKEVMAMGTGIKGVQYALGTGDEGVVDFVDDPGDIDPVTGKPIPKKVTKKDLETMQVTSGNADVGSRYSNITGYQTGVTNDKYGAGAYIFSPDLEGGREFISNSAVAGVTNSPQFKLYKQKLAAQIKAEQAAGKPVSSYMHVGNFANGTGPGGTGTYNTPTQQELEHQQALDTIEALRLAEGDSPWNFTSNLDFNSPGTSDVISDTPVAPTSSGAVISKPTTGGNSFMEKAGNWADENLPNVNLGDAVAIGGQLYSAFAPMNNTMENRAGDTPNVNAFKDFGKDALAAIDKSKGYVASQRDNALQRNVVSTRAARIGARNSARGANTMRATDIATELNRLQADSTVNDNFAKQMMDIFGQEAGLENAQDQAVMTGEYQRDLADRQDRDNFYTQKAKDIATKGEGIQNIGKNINAIKQNEMMTNMINQMGKYFTFDKDGNIIAIKSNTKTK